MAKPVNTVRTVTITLSTTEVVRDHLDRLASTGFYGKNPADAAERLLARVLEEMAKEGRLKGGQRKR